MNSTGVPRTLMPLSNHGAASSNIVLQYDLDLERASSQAIERVMGGNMLTEEGFQIEEVA
ncbi:hypothetical protein N7497_003883 [Penicillium chrysogenum]|jgi:hypothetical protein|nr:hypothetical protein N7497_003883 [Penicillium chrysogenum]